MVNDMELMRLTANNRIYNIFSDNINTEHPKIYGYIYENNHFYPLNEDIFKELNKLKIGSNAKKIGDYEKDNHSYDVILDLDTNLKHYFLNGKENFNLFINNFEDVIIADNRNIKYTDNLLDQDKKLDNTVRLLRVTSLSLLIFAECNFISKLDQLIDNNPPIESIAISDSIEIDSEQSIYLVELMNNTPTLTTEIISDLIKNNKNINDSNKEILLNSGIIEFASQYVNENKEYAAKLYNIILPNFTIVEKNLKDGLGNWDNKNYIIKIDVNDIGKQYGLYFDEIYNNTIAHEFVHILQASYEYPFLYEACAGIISQEYTSTPYSYFISYPIEQKYIKILMEIIGSKSISEYNFTGSIEPIKKELEPYLSESEINRLFEIFKFNSNYVTAGYITQEQFDDNLRDIEKIYEKLYYNKYHCWMRANSAINTYLYDDLSIVYYSFSKYYFNNCNEHNYDSELYDLEAYKLATNTYNPVYDNPAYNQVSFMGNGKDLLNDLNFNTLKQAFYSNQNLSKEEKDMLFNEEFVNDYIYYTRMYLNYRIIQKYIHYNRHNIITCLNKMRVTNDDRCIIGSEPEDEFPYRISAIDLENCEIVISESNCKQYASKNNFSYDDVCHQEKVKQFVRFLPECYDNNILNNACIDIILKEYYGIELPRKDNISIIEEKATKILIELIGSEPLKYYYFTGSDRLIKEQLNLLNNSNSMTVNIIGIFEERIGYHTIDSIDNINNIKYNLSSQLLSLNNIKNNVDTYNLLGFDDESHINYIENYMDNYYIPETKGYFSKSYIEKDKLSHPENYSNISFEENNDLGKRR